MIHMGKIINTELLAPAGSLQKLKTAVHFGADAVYFGGKDFGLRAYSDNFDYDEIEKGIKYLHRHGKRGYVTVNIFAKNDDFESIKSYLGFLSEVRADAVIISDLGVLSVCRKHFPQLEVHISTQANTLNKYAAKTYEGMGAKRIVLARELSVREISEICRYLSPGITAEVFVHGAMCISYSGRCLLSNYLSTRDSNRGECVQACRWQYEMREAGRPESKFLGIEEDSRGVYILNSKDLCLITRLNELAEAGVYSFKIEGRMKSEYYVANTINAYRRAINLLKAGKETPDELIGELFKAAHRDYTQGFVDGDNDRTQNFVSSSPVSTHTFIANVLGYESGRGVKVTQRNRFKEGDILEVLSPGDSFNKTIKVNVMRDEEGNIVQDAKLVQQTLYIETDIQLSPLDILRRKDGVL